MTRNTPTLALARSAAASVTIAILPFSGAIVKHWHANPVATSARYFGA